METLTEFKTRIIEYLAGLTSFTDAAIVAAYPEKARAFPLKKPVVTVEISGAELSPAGLGRYLGGDTPLYGMTAIITLRFCIYATEAEKCGNLFESLCNALFASSLLSVQSIKRGESLFDTETAAHLLYADASLKAAWVSKTEEERLFENVQIIC